MTRRTFNLLALGGYLAVIAIATVTPVRLDLDPEAIARRFVRALHPAVSNTAAVDAVRNIALFAGWGALLTGTRAGAWGWRTVRDAVATGLVVSLAVETIQLFSPVRNTNVVDLVTNTVGALVGSVSVIWICGVMAERRTRRSYVGLPAALFAAAYLAALVLEALFPALRLELVPGVSGSPLDRLSAVLAQFTLASTLNVPWFDMVLFAPAGALAVAALAEEGVPRRRAAWFTAVIGVAVMAAAEVVHGSFGFPVQVGAVLVHGGAIGLGAAVGARWLATFARAFRGWARPAFVLGTYGVLLLAWAWRPFVPETDLAVLLGQLELVRLIPLSGHAWRVEMFSVADVFLNFLLYLPVGALLAVWPLKTRGPLRGVWPALYVALCAEGGQLVVRDRFPDGTDWLVASAAAVMGWAVVRRAGYDRHGVVLHSARRDPGGRRPGERQRPPPPRSARR